MNQDEKKLVPVMITPYNLKAKIDLDAIHRLVEFYIAAGAKGLFTNCLSSEMYSISEDERLELTRSVVRYAKGRVPVVATGSFGLTIEDKAEFTKKIYDTGIHAVVLITSHYANVEDNDEILLRNFDKMLQLTGSVPLGLYECPAPYKRILSPSVLEKLITTNRFLFHKDTSIQQDSVKAKLDLVRNRTGFEFYDAHTPNAMFSMQAGAKGMSCISANFYPEVIAWMCKNVNNPNKQDEVKWLQSELTQADPLIHIAYPMSAKYFLRKRGMPVKTISRAHALEQSPAQKLALDNLYDKFNNWCARLKITQVNVEDVLLPDGRLDPAI